MTAPLTPLTLEVTNHLVALLIDEANDGVRVRHCGRKTFSEDPIWRGLNVAVIRDEQAFVLAHRISDYWRAAFAVQNERGTWRQLSAEEAWPVYREAFISDRYHGCIFESDYHEQYSREVAA